MTPALLLATALATLGAPARAADPPPTSPWVTVVAHAEVRVDADTAHLGGASGVSVWLRWRFADRAASPRAWDAGVRHSLDAAEVDCAAGATRTIASTGYSAAGEVVDAATFADDAAGWRRNAPGSVGREVAGAVCRLAARRSAGQGGA